MPSVLAVTAPFRPLLRWHGGKWVLAPWIIRHFPRHRTYVEPFGGAASVLLRKDPSYAEVYNDLDDDVVNLLRVLRSPESERLIQALRLTPFARTEFEIAYQVSDDPVEEARRLVIRSFMGFGSDGFNRAVKTGFRSNSNRSGTTPAFDWTNYPDSLSIIVQRLAGVVIENRDAMEVMLQHDSPDTLHYADPPYMPDTRSDKSRKGGGKYHTYRHEMSDEQHATLLEGIRRLKGMVIVSGYHTDLYDELLSDWRRVEKVAMADGARERMEVLWINPSAVERLGSGPLFEMAAVA